MRGRSAIESKRPANGISHPRPRVRPSSAGTPTSAPKPGTGSMTKIAAQALAAKSRNCRTTVLASVCALNAEIDEVEKGVLLDRFREDAEGVPCYGAVVSRARDGVAQRAVPLHELDGLLEIALALVEVLERAAPERSLRFAAAAEGKHDRQGDLAVAEIVANILAERVAAGCEVEHVIDQLEGDA